MGKFRIIFFLLSSSFLIFTSCQFQKLQKQNTINEIVLNQSQLKAVIPFDRSSIKYKAELDVLNKHFTGIVVLKQTNDSTKHLVFVTELGMRMFDFVIQKDEVKSEFVFEALNKPNLVKALTNSFRTLLLINCINKNAELKNDNDRPYFWIKDATNTIALWKDNTNFASTMKVFSGRKKSSITNYQANYSSISFKQYGLVKLKIKLTQLQD